jgi:hypothetical protein
MGRTMAPLFEPASGLAREKMKPVKKMSVATVLKSTGKTSTGIAGWTAPHPHHGIRRDRATAGQ